MQLRLKTTGFPHTSWLEELVESKISRPLLRRVGRGLSPESVLDVELAKVTRHHSEGRIWKCEANLPLPGARKTLFAEALEESLEEAVDRVKEELEREIDTYKGKQVAKGRALSRRMKAKFRKS